MPTIELDIPTAEVFEPLLAPARYKGAKGGRSSGKSWFFAGLAVEGAVAYPNRRFVCIREVQRSLRYSAKSVIERKIRALEVSDLFDVTEREIRRVGGEGVMIFEGMQDHTADSIRSLEGFDRAWVEEAHSLSKRSLDILTPTIRAPGSEIWFSWNPDQPEDPVDAFFGGGNPDKLPDGAVLVHTNYLDNPFCPTEAIQEAERLRRVDPEGYAHVWLGQYNLRSDVQVLVGKCRVDEFKERAHWDGPYFGADWGFSRDPTVIVRCWIGDDRLWIDHEDGGIQWDSDTIERRFRAIPGAATHVIRADSARPETIAALRDRGLDIQAAEKWKGSVEDGIQFLRSFDEIVIHERCPKTTEEARLWRYKTDRLTGDPLPKLEDGHEHRWDAIRYALAPLIRRREELPPFISQSHYTG
ncbi:MAG: PBSX family phage terminase large subunit [Trueperaceae bacterium]|nr:PBSX family phage terminase large subunit [Trueperaceae bacterium]